MRCARTGTRRWNKVFRVVRVGRGAVGDADRRVYVPVADLKPGGAEHPADAAHERFADALSHLRLSYNFLRDIAPVAGVIRVPNIMAVHPSFPPRSVPEFIAKVIRAANIKPE